jgi:hypothetical protein
MIYVYKRTAGNGTEETFWSADKYSDEDMWDMACEHAESYGNYFNEDSGEFEDGDGESAEYAECWLKGTISNLKELEEHSGHLLYGNDKFEDLRAEMEKEQGFAFE